MVPTPLREKEVRVLTNTDDRPILTSHDTRAQKILVIQGVKWLGFTISYNKRVFQPSQQMRWVQLDQDSHTMNAGLSEDCS